MTSATDPRSNTTSYSHADSFRSGSGTPPSQTNAYLTQVTMPRTNPGNVSHVEKFTYQYSDGQLASSIDQNSKTTSYSYNDDLGRLTQTSFPDSGETTEAYSDSGTTPSVTTTILLSSSSSLTTKTIMDGVGHTIETQLTSDPISTVYSDTTYDGLGRVATKSNPYRTTGDATYGLTSYQYDALGRTLKVTTPDSSVATTSYYGPTATVTDQAGHVRTLTSDPLNRLGSVTEDPGTGHFNYVTNYTYNALDDLIGVNQNNSGVVRTFYYDSLKRLLAASNPENASASAAAGQTCTGASGSAWTTCYSYDNSGNLLTKRDNRGTTTTSSYDALNRVSAKTYSDSTPPVTYTYDATATNSIGHLTSVSNSNSTTNYTSFDPMGRVTASTQVTGGQSYSFTYAYNLAGSLKTESYPSGRVATTVYDNTNHATSLTGALAGNNTNYVSGVTYWPHGAEWLLTYGNNVVPVYSYNNRLQTSNAYATIGNSGSQYLLYLGYNWGTSNNNGNLQGSSEGYGASVPSGSLSWLSQSYLYDAVNRVTSVSDTGYSRTFGYDAYGNAWVKTNSGVPLAGNTPTSNVFNGNNQIGGGSYDAAGNQTGVNGDTAAYDAESRQSSLTEPASLGSGVENYLYDGNGQRVEKTGPDGATIYVYDAAGRVAAEYGTSGLASPCTTCYMVTDSLGTARLVTDAGANVIARHDYLPFGEEIAGGTAGRSSVWGPEADTISHKFTGKERDSESGLDYFGARYYGSALGRFSSPDTVQGSPEDPQSWNLYGYVRNNPMTNTDPDGHDCVVQSRTSESSESVSVSSGTCDGVQVGDGQTKTYVPGTVSGIQAGADGHSIDIGYTAYGANGGTSSSVTNANAAPIPDNPNLAYYWGNNAQGYKQLAGASDLVDKVGAGYAAVYGGVACLAVCPSAVAAVGQWGLQRLAMGATSPALLNLVNRLYQAQDELPGGTAGAVRNEVSTGEYITYLGGHAIKAEDTIRALQKLINSGELSGSDQTIAGHIISDLKNSLGK